MDSNTPNIPQDSASSLKMNGTNNFVDFNGIGKTESEDSDTNNSEDPFKNGNVIMLGSIVPKETADNFNGETSRRSRPKELEALGVVEDEENNNKEFDMFTVENKPEMPSINDTPLLLAPDKIKIEGQAYSCPDEQCSKVYNFARKLQTHLRQEHNIKYTCTMCSEKFETNTELVTHKSVHNSEKQSYICNGCKLAFSNHCDFLIHELTHCKHNEIYVCPECGLTSKAQFKMKIHIYSHFQSTMSCPICNEEVSAHMLSVHMRIHNRIECIECGKFLYNKRRYDEHMSVHTGVKPHQCLYCGKGFARLENKVVHTRIHTNKRPFSCNVCDKKFAQYITMKRHVQTHDKSVEKEGRK